MSAEITQLYPLVKKMTVAGIEEAVRTIPASADQEAYKLRIWYEVRKACGTDFFKANAQKLSQKNLLRHVRVRKRLVKAVGLFKDKLGAESSDSPTMYDVLNLTIDSGSVDRNSFNLLSQSDNDAECQQQPGAPGHTVRETKETIRHIVSHSFPDKQL